MTLSTRTQFASVFAAIACAFITVGTSIAPAITSVSTQLA